MHCNVIIFTGFCPTKVWMTKCHFSPGRYKFLIIWRKKQAKEKNDNLLFKGGVFWTINSDYCCMIIASWNHFYFASLQNQSNKILKICLPFRDANWNKILKIFLFPDFKTILIINNFNLDWYCFVKLFTKVISKIFMLTESEFKIQNLSDHFHFKLFSLWTDVFFL